VNRKYNPAYAGGKVREEKVLRRQKMGANSCCNASDDIKVGETYNGPSGKLFSRFVACGLVRKRFFTGTRIPMAWTYWVACFRLFFAFSVFVVLDLVCEQYDFNSCFFASF